jgi:hypothetical protein
MNFINAGNIAAGWTLGFAADGREQLVVVAKATYRLPANGEPAELAPEQLPLVQEDVFTGDPAMSAPLYETDYAHRKPRCDVVLLGSAHARPGQRATRLPVGLRLGPLVKQFVVVGHRHWTRGVLGPTPGKAEPFERMPIGYDSAFGGTDRTREARQEVHTFLANPVGRGFGKHPEHYMAQPLPNSEDPGQPIDSPTGNYRPLAFGPIGRNWTPRLRYAGTYDQSWLEQRLPLWPDDFDDRYFQCAPPDQQMDYPQGGEDIVLLNLTPDGRRSFKLPARPMPVHVTMHRGRDTTAAAKLDTIVIEPDAGRFSLAWRAVIDMPRSLFDVQEAIVGEMPPTWHRARRFPGKTYYRNLAELVQAWRRPRA